MPSPPRFARKLAHVYNIAPDRPAYWANASSVVDAALYQQAFLDAFKKHHDQKLCDAKDDKACIRRMHAPICDKPDCFKGGMFVVSSQKKSRRRKRSRSQKSPATLTLESSAMPWIDAVIFVANRDDIQDALSAVKKCKSMELFQIPVSEKAPFGHCNSLMQNAAQSPNSINLKDNNDPLYLKSLIDKMQGSVCIACKAGSNRSTSSLIAYALLSSPSTDLHSLLDYFRKIRQYQIFDYNMSQLITISELKRHGLLTTDSHDTASFELLPSQD
jgi:hypothetical protein